MLLLLIGLLCSLTIERVLIDAQSLPNNNNVNLSCDGWGNSNQSAILLYQLNDTLKERYSSVNTGGGCFTGVNYNYKYYTPIWFEVTSMGWFEIKSVVWYYLVTVQNLQGTILSTYFVDVSNATRKQDNSDVGIIGAMTVKTMDLYSNPNNEQDDNSVEAFYSVFFTSNNRISTGLYSLNINNNQSRIISYNVEVDVLIPYYPVFVKDGAIICFFLTNDVGIMCKRKTKTSDSWQTIQWEGNLDVLKVKSSGFFPIASSASLVFLGCTTIRESLSKGSNVCYRLNPNENVLLSVNVSSYLPVKNSGDIRLLCGDPWLNFVFYTVVPEEDLLQEKFTLVVWSSLDVGTSWFKVNEIVYYMENAYVYSLLPLKGFLFGTSNVKTRELILPSTNSLNEVFYSNVLQIKNQSEFKMSLSGPIYFSSFIGGINQTIQGINGKNTLEQKQLVSTLLKQTSIWSQICFYKYNTSTHSSSFISELVQGVSSTNENYQSLVGYSVGFICGIVACVVSYSAIMNI